jgi:putative endonuclease
VKARSSSTFGDPEDAVDTPKMSHIFDAAEEYIFQHNWQGHIRFDVIAIKFGNEIHIEHFEDAMS